VHVGQGAEERPCSTASLRLAQGPLAFEAVCQVAAAEELENKVGIGALPRDAQTTHDVRVVEAAEEVTLSPYLS